jgi:hypothetical protein
MATMGQLAKLSVVLIGLLVAGCNSAPPRETIVTRTDAEMLARARLLPDDPGLRFPYRDPFDVFEVRCFGLHPWSPSGERHGGIDIIPHHQNVTGNRMEKYTIVAPEDAVVDRIVKGTTGADARSLTVVLQYNPYWYGLLTFEPQSLDEDVFVEQVESIRVRAGERVRRGDLIGHLVVWKFIPGIWPHLHYGLLYKQPEHTLDYIGANYLEIARSDGSRLPPTTGPGSPWEAENLEIPSTVFCPYEYSSPRARACFDSYPKRSARGDYCGGVCAYNSSDYDCGDTSCLYCVPAP